MLRRKPLIEPRKGAPAMFLRMVLAMGLADHFLGLPFRDFGGLARLVFVIILPVAIF